MSNGVCGSRVPISTDDIFAFPLNETDPDAPTSVCFNEEELLANDIEPEGRPFDITYLQAVPYPNRTSSVSWGDGISCNSSYFMMEDVNGELMASVHTTHYTRIASSIGGVCTIVLLG